MVDRRQLELPAGKNPDHYSTSLAIEKILAEGFPASWRRKRVAAE
jgi:hypothetical protein